MKLLEMTRTPKSKVLTVGPDHNAHIRRERTREANGRYCLMTSTTEAGGEHHEWCVLHNPQRVNSFSKIRKRGTSFNHSHRREFWTFRKAYPRVDKPALWENCVMFWDLSQIP